MGMRLTGLHLPFLKTGVTLQFSETSLDSYDLSKITGIIFATVSAYFLTSSGCIQSTTMGLCKYSLASSSFCCRLLIHFTDLRLLKANLFSDDSAKEVLCTTLPCPLSPFHLPTFSRAHTHPNLSLLPVKGFLYSCSSPDLIPDEFGFLKPIHVCLDWFGFF